jgi:hypothetical protein
MLLLHRILSEFSAKNVAKLFPLYDREQDDLLISVNDESKPSIFGI